MKYTIKAIDIKNQLQQTLIVNADCKDKAIKTFMNKTVLNLKYNLFLGF